MTVACSPLSSDPSFPSARTGPDPSGHNFNHSSSPLASAPYPSSDDDSDDEDEDEDDYNLRVVPHWQIYRHLFESYGYHLDTCKDVRQFYLRYWETRNIQQSIQSCAGYRSACGEDRNDNDLCKDEGLPDRLFRGKRLSDDLPIVIKAVHRRSRELEIVTALSTPPLRGDPMNHCIPVLDIIHAPRDVPHPFHLPDRNQLSFIVMEEWASQFIPPEQPHTLRSCLNSLRYCIEHIAFMHNHCFAHLDISLRNVLADYNGRCAFIDYETSRRFCQPPVGEGGDPRSGVLVYQLRAAEVPPEVEQGHPTSPYAMDVWALGILMSEACTSAGYDVPELRPVINGMLEPQWERRPSAEMVLRRFERAIMNVPEERLNGVPYPS